MFESKKKEAAPRVIGLLTDFGLSDPYVGQMKAVLARKAPACTVVDISHDVAPFNVAQAGFFLAASHVHFPEDAILLAVVDPGVGTDRKIIGLQLDGQLVIAPDNGLAALVLKASKAKTVRAFDLSLAMDAPKSVSHTFHGRDVFTPLAAWMALGGSRTELGGEIDPSDLVSHDWSQPAVASDHAEGHVLHIDRFGNCVLNLPAGSLPEVATVTLSPLSREPIHCVDTYGELGLGASGLLEGSQGFMEIAVNQRSAADKFGLTMGDAITLTWEV